MSYAPSTCSIPARRLAAAMMTGAMCALLALPVHSAEMRMSVSAVVLSHCAMQLTGATIAGANTIGAAPFTARCNTPVAPRVRSGLAGSASPVLPDISAAMATPAAGKGTRAQSAVISADDGQRRIVRYIQYTIEY